MPTYNYRCTEHGVSEQTHSCAARHEATCPECDKPAKLIHLSAPSLDIEAMARAGMPGAWETVGSRITKRHTSVDQSHRSGGLSRVKQERVDAGTYDGAGPTEHRR